MKKKQRKNEIFITFKLICIVLVVYKKGGITLVDSYVLRGTTHCNLILFTSNKKKRNKKKQIIPQNARHTGLSILITFTGVPCPVLCQYLFMNNEIEIRLQILILKSSTITVCSISK